MKINYDVYVCKTCLDMQNPLNDGIYVISIEGDKRKGLFVENNMKIISEVYESNMTVGQIIDDLIGKRHNLSIDEPR